MSPKTSVCAAQETTERATMGLRPRGSVRKKEKTKKACQPTVSLAACAPGKLRPRCEETWALMSSHSR